MNYSYPLKIKKNRYFTDKSGKPFFWHGDTCWKLFWEYTADEAREYLENRAEIGFNIIQVHLLPHRFYQANRNGDRPFEKDGGIIPECRRRGQTYFRLFDSAANTAIGDFSQTKDCKPRFFSV